MSHPNELPTFHAYLCLFMTTTAENHMPLKASLEILKYHLAALLESKNFLLAFSKSHTSHLPTQFVSEAVGTIIFTF